MSNTESGLKKLLDDYQDRSATASTIARNSGFAGIAVIWIFRKNDVGGEVLLPTDLIQPLAYLVTFLILDFLHYFIGTIVGGITHKLKAMAVTKKEIKDDEVEWPEYFSIINWTIWVIKMLPFIIGYCLLLKYLIKTITASV